jgi:hypothetical protein
MIQEAQIRETASDLTAGVMPRQPLEGTLSRTEAERAELQAVLDSGWLARSPAMVMLLGYLCEKYFAGEAHCLKEYTIGVEALGRGADFQQKEDPIVRVEIRRLRDKLRKYYETTGAGRAVQLTIPTGQYTLVFVHQPPETQLAEPPSYSALVAAEPALAAAAVPPGLPSGIRRSPWLLAACLALGLGLAALAVTLRPRLATNAEAPPATVGLTSAGSSNAGARALPTEVGLRIKAGSNAPEFVDSAGRVWGPDRYFTGGDIVQSPNAFIYRTLDPEIYRSARTGAFAYDIPLQPGVYELRLHFVELRFGPGEYLSGGETSRLVNVFINERPALERFDIISDARGNRVAEVKVFKDIAPAADGLLHLKFVPLDRPAVLSGIELAPAQPGRMNPLRFTTNAKICYTADQREWLSDRYFLGGRTEPRQGIVAGAADQDLYQYERYGNFSYAIPVPPGRYTALLRFAERYFGASNPGKTGASGRLFDLFCNGQALVKNLDVYKEAGGENRELVKKFSGLTPNAQGKLILDFVPVKNYALVNAIEIVAEK